MTSPDGPPQPGDGPAHPEPVSESVSESVGSDDGWQQLDWRMLLIGPLDALRQFAIPALIALIGVSSSAGGFQPWVLIPAVGIPVVIGFLPWLTTRYRITATQFQQKSGLLNKKQVTAPLDRVRSVDLESSVFHRVLGVTKVKVGTGVDDTRIELQALSVPQADELRRFLLARGRSSTAADWVQTAVPGAESAPFGPKPHEFPDPEAAHEEPQVLAEIDWSWLRFAPFSLSRLAIVAGAVGVLAQFGEDLPWLDEEHLDAGISWLLGFAIPLLVLGILVTGLVVWVFIAVTGYVVQWWDMRLSREHGTLRLTAGLLTTRATTVEEAKVRGVEMTEPVLLRAVKGAELSTLATGVGEGGVTKVLPPCPREVCVAVGRSVLEDDEPLTVPLIPHGPAALRRCHIRAQWSTVIFTAVAVVPVVVFGWPWWFPVVVAITFAVLGVGVGRTSYRHLGHRLTRHHLAAGSGALERTRTVLERDGVIGWVVKQSFFQRRRGLATLTATTAAGAEKVLVRDVPLGLAIGMARTVTPGAVAPFLGS